MNDKALFGFIWSFRCSTEVWGLHPWRLCDDVADGEYETAPGPQEASLQSRLHTDMGKPLRLHLLAIQGQPHTGRHQVPEAWNLLDEAP